MFPTKGIEVRAIIPRSSCFSGCPGADQPGKNRAGWDKTRNGFSLVEILVVTVIFSVIMLMAVGIFGQVSSLWGGSVEQAKAFQSARLAFDLVTRNAAQATLNTYLDYADANNRFATDEGFDDKRLGRYARRSDLHFVSAVAGKSIPGEDKEYIPGRENSGSAIFFQAPLGFSGTDTTYAGLNQLLTVCGYYVEFDDDSTRPDHVPSAPIYRYRLKQMLVPSQEITIYKNKPGGFEWFVKFTDKSNAIADNIIAFVVRAQYPGVDPDSTETVYDYDSKKDERNSPQPPTANQMPPLLQISMVAINESSARRIENGASPPAVIQDALNGKFQDPSEYEKDMDELKTKLLDEGIYFYVFSTTVPVRESRWSK